MSVEQSPIDLGQEALENELKEKIHVVRRKLATLRGKELGLRQDLADLAAEQAFMAEIRGLTLTIGPKISTITGFNGPRLDITRTAATDGQFTYRGTFDGRELPPSEAQIRWNDKLAAKDDPNKLSGPRIHLTRINIPLTLPSYNGTLNGEELSPNDAKKYWDRYFKTLRERERRGRREVRARNPRRG